MYITRAPCTLILIKMATITRNKEWTVLAITRHCHKEAPEGWDMGGIILSKIVLKCVSDYG